MSFGLGEWPYAGPSKDSLIACADASLYAMKRDGGTGTGARAGTDDRESEAKLDAQGQRRRLAAARRLSAQLAPLRDPVSVARATVDELAASFDWFLVILDRLDPVDDTLRPLAAAGELVEMMGGVGSWSQTAAAGVKGRAVRTGEPVVVPDTARDPDFMGPDDVPVESRSELALPIRVGGEIWGVLNLESSEPDAFGPDDLVFADLLAGHVGAALDRCRLLDELEGTFTTTLAVLSDALERKDAYTAAHADEVADLTVRVGRSLGIEGDDLRTLKLRRAAPRHRQDRDPQRDPPEAVGLDLRGVRGDQGAHEHRRRHAGADPVLRGRRARSSATPTSAGTAAAIRPA